MGKALVEKAPSKEELASVPSCNLVSNDLRVWMFPQFFRFVQKRSSCEEVELSEGLQKNVAEVLKTPQRPLAFPIDRVGVKKSEWDVCWKCVWRKGYGYGECGRRRRLDATTAGRSVNTPLESGSDIFL